MPRPLSIAVLAHSTNPRGGVVHAMALAEALTALGHRAVLFAPDAGGAGFFREPRCESVAFPVAPALPGTAAMVEQRVGDYLRHFDAAGTHGFDLFHAHDGISGNALATLKEHGRIRRFVRTVHHVDSFADPRVAALQRRSIVSADGWATVSRGWRDQLARDWGIEAAVVGNGVDLERFPAARDGREDALRSRLGLGAAPVFLAVGGVEARKNTLGILDAFVQLHHLRPDARLVIAGGVSLLDHGGYRAEFRTALDRAGAAAAAVHVIGRVDDADMAPLYRLAAALVFASVKEGFGLCVLEALASGIPAIVSAIPPFTEYLAPEDALWCAPSRPASIAEAMMLALDPVLAADLSARGPTIAARHDWPSVARAHLPLYDHLAEAAHA